MAERTFGDPPGGGPALGWLYAAIPLGSFAVGVLSGWLHRIRRHGIGVTIAVIGWGLAIIGFGLSGSLWLAVLFLALGGGADLVSMVYRSAMLQAAATDEMRGRIQGVFTVVVAGGPRLADVLPVDRELTVVTHSPTSALALSGRGNITLMLVGGRLRGRTLAAVDDWALHALSDIFVDVAFMATNGLSLERGLTTPDSAEAMVKRAAIAAARRTGVLADRTKVGNDHFARFGDLADVDTLITDDGLDEQVAEEIRRAGPRVEAV